MQRLEVSCAVRPIYGSLGAKGFRNMLDEEEHDIEISHCFGEEDESSYGPSISKR
jgi:hypothetical protein